MIKLVCCTLPYARYSMERALDGISKAGYKYVGFGLRHEGQPVPSDDPSADELAKLKEEFAKRDLQPTLMWGTSLAGEADLSQYRRRVDVAKELGVTTLLGGGTWGYRKFPDEPLSESELAKAHQVFVDNVRQVAPYAQEAGIQILLKPHTGNTATAALLAKTIKDINAPNVVACYDPGNVSFYEGLAPDKDLAPFVNMTASIVAKDHQGPRAHGDFPVPGEGAVDFPAIFDMLAKAGFAGLIAVERVDGAPTGPIPPEELDVRIARARKNLLAIAAKANLGPVE